MKAGAARSGNFGANLKKTTWIQKQTSTLGFSQVTLVFTWRTKNYEAGEQAVLEWSTNGGSTWNAVDTNTAKKWQNEEFVLPAAAAGKADFRIRFRTNAVGVNPNGKKKSTHVDVVRIIGD